MCTVFRLTDMLFPCPHNTSATRWLSGTISFSVTAAVECRLRNTRFPSLQCIFAVTPLLRRNPYPNLLVVLRPHPKINAHSAPASTSCRHTDGAREPGRTSEL
jgi:hypothetical protein